MFVGALLDLGADRRSGPARIALLGLGLGGFEVRWVAKDVRVAVGACDFGTWCSDQTHEKPRPRTWGTSTVTLTAREIGGRHPRGHEDH